MVGGFKTKARFTFDGNNIPDEQAYQADLEQNNEIITNDHTDFGPLIDETNVLVEAFDSAEENIVENETESESEDDDDWYKSDSVFCNWCNYVEFLMYYEIDVTIWNQIRLLFFSCFMLFPFVIYLAIFIENAMNSAYHWKSTPIMNHV